MAFLKINRFAGILAIACACLLPALVEASEGDVFYSAPNGCWVYDNGSYESCIRTDETSKFIDVTSFMTFSGFENITVNFDTIGTRLNGGSVSCDWYNSPTGYTDNWLEGSIDCNFSTGKIKVDTQYNCVSAYGQCYMYILPLSPYDGIYGGNYPTPVWGYGNKIGFNSDDGYFLQIIDGAPWLSIEEYNTVFINNFGTPPIPPPQPAEIVINGLNCKTEVIPDLKNVTWYNDFMNNTGFLKNVDDDGWIRFFSWSGSIYDLPYAQYTNRAGLYYADQTSGGNFASGSLNYPGTARTTIRGGNKSPLLLSFSDSEIKPNIVQWHGVNEVALGYAGTVQFQNTQNLDTPEVPISSTGGIATAVISGNERIKKVLLNYSSGFNGFRYGVAPTIAKNACTYKYNICEWSIEGNNTVCQSGNLVGGIPAGNCVVTSSGSVYGSGSCVPETNGSGAIIPPVIVPGITVYDSNGNPVGNIYDNESVTPDLSCDYSTTDGWTDKIGKTFQCVTSFFSSSAKLSKDGVSGITGVSQQLGESIKQDIGTNTGTTATGSSNMLLNSLYGVDEGVKEYKYVKLSYALLIFTVTVFLIVMLSIILKSGINNIKN